MIILVLILLFTAPAFAQKDPELDAANTACGQHQVRTIFKQDPKTHQRIAVTTYEAGWEDCVTVNAAWQEETRQLQSQNPPPPAPPPAAPSADQKALLKKFGTK